MRHRKSDKHKIIPDDAPASESKSGLLNLLSSHRWTGQKNYDCMIGIAALLILVCLFAECTSPTAYGIKSPIGYIHCIYIPRIYTYDSQGLVVVFTCCFFGVTFRRFNVKSLMLDFNLCGFEEKGTVSWAGSMKFA